MEVGEVAERSNATDCKSVALVASEVRILPSPPTLRCWWGRQRQEVGNRTGGLATVRAGKVRCCEGGSNSVVESQPSKLLVAGSIPVSRSSFVWPEGQASEFLVVEYWGGLFQGSESGNS